MSDLPKFPHVFSEGDEKPLILFVLQDGKSLDDFTVTLLLERPDNTVILVTGVDISGGGSKGKFQFAATDLIEGCNQLAQAHTTEISTGDIQHEGRFLIDVAKKLVVTP